MQHLLTELGTRYRFFRFNDKLSCRLNDSLSCSRLLKQTARVFYASTTVCFHFNNSLYQLVVVVIYRFVEIKSLTRLMYLNYLVYLLLCGLPKAQRGRGGGGIQTFSRIPQNLRTFICFFVWGDSCGGGYAVRGSFVFIVLTLPTCTKRIGHRTASKTKRPGKKFI